MLLFVSLPKFRGPLVHCRHVTNGKFEPRVPITQQLGHWMSLMPCIFCTHDLQVVVPLLGRIDLRQDSPVQITKHISPQDAQTYPLTREEMYIPSPAASPLGESISKKSRLYRSTPLYAAAENVSHPLLPRLPSHTIHGVQLANQLTAWLVTTQLCLA